MFGRSSYPTSSDSDKSGVRRGQKSAPDARLFNADPRLSPRGRGDIQAPASNKRESVPDPKTAPPPQPMGRILTVPKGIALSGKINACDVLIIEGSVEATLTDGKIIRIAEGGAFRGTIEIADADIAGVFEGALTVHGRLTVRGKGRVAGKIRYGQLAVEPGGNIQGELALIEKRDSRATEKTAETAQRLDGLLASIQDDSAGLSVDSVGDKQQTAGDLMSYAVRRTSSLAG